MFSSQMHISNFDAELWEAMQLELERQEDHIELIASENYASPRVLEAQGSVLINKYAEGYPYKRYYGGCEYVDIVEQLAIDRVKKLFGAAYANVQPHSGSRAERSGADGHGHARRRVDTDRRRKGVEEYILVHRHARRGSRDDRRHGRRQRHEGMADAPGARAGRAVEAGEMITSEKPSTRTP